MNKINLDERQLWLRGEVFKHSLFLMGGLLLLYTFLSNFEWLHVGQFRTNIFIVGFTAAFANVELIWKGAVDFEDVRMAAFAAVEGACGGMLVVLNILHIAGLFGQLEGVETGLSLLMGLGFVAIPMVYFPKRRAYRAGENE